MTTGPAVLRLRLDIIRCNTPPFLLTLFYLGQNMSERNNILNILSSHGGATCGCACCRMCYRNSVLGIWFSDSSFVFFFSLYPSVSAPSLPVFLLPRILFQTASVWSSNFEAISPVPDVRRLTFLTLFLIFILFLWAVAWMQLFTMTPSHHSWPHSSQCVSPPSCLSSCTVKGSLSSWIKAGCPSRQRRRKDNARYLWWVVNKTLHLQRLIGSN